MPEFDMSLESRLLSSIYTLPTGGVYEVGEATAYPIGFTFPVLLNLMLEAKSFFFRGANQSGIIHTEVFGYTKRTTEDGIATHKNDYSYVGRRGYDDDFGTFTIHIDFKDIRAKQFGQQWIYYPRFQIYGAITLTANEHSFSTSDNTVGTDYQPDPPRSLYVCLPKWAVPYKEDHITMLTTTENVCFFKIPIYSEDFFEYGLCTVAEKYSDITIDGTKLSGKTRGLQYITEPSSDTPGWRNYVINLQGDMKLATIDNKVIQGTVNSDNDLCTLDRAPLGKEYPLTLIEDRTHPPSPDTSSHCAGYLY